MCFVPRFTWDSLTYLVLRCTLCLFVGLLCSSWSYAQSNTISGFVTDAESGERLIGANLYVVNKNTGTVTNTYGFYSLTLPNDSVYLRVSFLGFQARNFAVDLKADVELNIGLLPEPLNLETVEVVAERVENDVQSSQMSLIDVGIKEVQTLPAMFGEADILKTLQLLPGVQAGSEGNNGLYVRGGGPDQNLVLLDGAPVYNANHIFGFLSVFNSHALRNVSLIKGGFPARYGGRLSSVIDISMKEGNLKRWETDGALGLVSSSLTLQGPIVKDRMSFIVSGRRTYIDYLLRPFIRSDEGEDPVFFFYDVNAKVNYIVNEKNRVYASVYAGRDEFGSSFEEENINSTQDFRGSLDWGNLTSTLRWNHLFGNKLFANTAFIYSKYQFNTLSRTIEIYQEEGGTNQLFNQITYRSGIRDLTLKVDFDYVPVPTHYVRFGASATRHAFTPGVGRYRFEQSGELSVDSELTPETEVFKGAEYYSYLEDDISIGRRTKANLGVHYSSMDVRGTYYSSLQPRIAMRYLVSPDLSIKASFSTMQQYLHLLNNSGISLPTDLWVAATDRVKPQNAWQAASGVNYAFPSGRYELSVEGYYKEMKNLIEFRPGTSFLETNVDWQNKIEVGEGWSYGAELFFQKKTGRMSGWIGYTLSWTERQFEGLNQGRVFPYRYDRRHDVSVVATYKLSDELDIGATWVYGTGNAITLATSRFQYIEFSEFNKSADLLGYGGRNGYRMAPYHRLDIAFNWHKERAWYSRKGSSTFSLSLYNTYVRRNPFFIYGTGRSSNIVTSFEEVETQSVYRYRQLSLFPFIPSISYRFHF